MFPRLQRSLTSGEAENSNTRVLGNRVGDVAEIIMNQLSSHLLVKRKNKLINLNVEMLRPPLDNMEGRSISAGLLHVRRMHHVSFLLLEKNNAIE